MPMPPTQGGFSETALRALDDLDANAPPLEAYEKAFVSKRRGSGSHGFSHNGSEARGRPHFWGHRERLRQRFMTAKTGELPPYEILELILFNAVPRRDVKPLAKELLAAFGDLNGVISAPEARLMSFTPSREVKVDYKASVAKILVQFRLSSEIAARMARAKVIDRSVLSSWDALIDYCKTVMAHRETEQFRALYLDRKNVLICDEAQGEGTVDHVPVYPREVAKRALELNASAIILVHNHPSGDPTPSAADIDMTKRIVAACEAIGVVIHDHVVIGKETDASFRSLGLI